MPDPNTQNSQDPQGQGGTFDLNQGQDLNINPAPESTLNTGNGEPQAEPETQAQETQTPETPNPKTEEAHEIKLDELKPAKAESEIKIEAQETPIPEVPTPEASIPETAAQETPTPEVSVPKTPPSETPIQETPTPETPVPETPATPPVEDKESSPQELDKALEEQLAEVTESEPETEQSEKSTSLKKYAYIASGVIAVLILIFIAYKLFFAGNEEEVQEDTITEEISPADEDANIEEVEELENIVNQLEERYPPEYEEEGILMPEDTVYDEDPPEAVMPDTLEETPQKVAR